MSAHPQLSVQQASQIVSYILSVKDENKNIYAVPPSGTINPGNKKDKGEYILSVTYQDKERMGVPSNLAKKNFHFKYPMLKAVNAHNEKSVARLSESVVRFAESGSWILFKNIDLTNISSVLYFVDPTQIGGRLSLHLDKPDGKEISSISINQIKSLKKTTADQKNNKWKTVPSQLISEEGIHDLYIVYNDPQNAQSSMFTTLYLDWIEFRK